MTERLHFHFSLSCIGEGNGNPLQCSCLENPRDGGAWWAAVYGVAQSWTRLKWLSSSSSQGHGQLGMCYWEVTGLLSAVTGLQCWDYRFQQLDWGQDSQRFCHCWPWWNHNCQPERRCPLFHFYPIQISALPSTPFLPLHLFLLNRSSFYDAT